REQVDQHDHEADCSCGERGVRQQPGAHQVGCKGRRLATRNTVARPKTNPPICAKKATPPPCCGCRTAQPPSQSWNRNQTPRNRIAGTSRKKTKKKMNAVRTLARGSSRK